MGLRLGRHRQDQGADRPAAGADARRHRSGAHPVPDLHPRRGGRDGEPGQRPAGRVGDPAPRRAGRAAGRADRPFPAGARDRARPPAVRPRARYSGRRQDRDDPRLLPVIAAPFPARSRGAARIRRHRGAQRGRDADRGRREHHRRRARRQCRAARRGVGAGRALYSRGALRRIADVACRRPQQIARGARGRRDGIAGATGRGVLIA